MKTQKAKVRVLDVLLQIVIAILSLVTMVFCLAEFEGGYGVELLYSLLLYDPYMTFLTLAGLIFSVIVFVYAVFASRKVTETAIRGLFTFSLVIWGLWFYLWLNELISELADGFDAEMFLELTLVDFDMIMMILGLLFIFFSVARKHHTVVFIGQIVCLVLLVGKIALTVNEIVFVMSFEETDCYVATCAFHLILAFFSIWLHRKNYFRDKEAGTVAVCPYMNEAGVPQMRREPISMEWPEPVADVGDCQPVQNEDPTVVPVLVEESAEPEEALVEEPEVVEVPAEEPVAEQEKTAAPQLKEMFCINCGLLLDEGASFCGKCGTKVVG